MTTRIGPHQPGMECRTPVFTLICVKMGSASPMDTPSKAESPNKNSRAAATLLEILHSGRPLIYVRSTEEGRVAELLREAGRQLHPSAPLPVWTWSLTEGLSLDGEDEAEAPALDPREALDFIATHNEPAIFHLKDFHEPLRDSAGVRRRL